MYCPKCKTEYREGFKECSDCGVDLVPGKYVKDKVLLKEGISIIKLGIILLIFSISQLVSVIIIYDFYWVYKLKALGSAVASAMGNVHPVISLLTIIEFFTSFAVIIWGTSFKSSNN